MESHDEKFEYFKKLVMEHLDQLEQSEKNAVKKSLLNAESIAKGGLPVGTIRVWKGKKYIKIAPGKWRPKYDSNSRGAKMAIAAIKRAIDKCTTSEEMLQIILANRDRFSDEQGRPLPFVKELSDYISGRNDKIESTKAEKKAKKEEPKNTGFTLDDISHIGDGKETKKVNDMETAKNVIKQIAEKYGSTEKGRKELSDFIALNIGGSNPLYDKIYEDFNISYEDLDMDFDACHDLMLNQSLGKNTKKQREQIADSKDEFEDNYRQMLENEDDRYKEVEKEVKATVTDSQTNERVISEYLGDKKGVGDRIKEGNKETIWGNDYSKKHKLEFKMNVMGAILGKPQMDQELFDELSQYSLGADSHKLAPKYGLRGEEFFALVNKVKEKRVTIVNAEKDEEAEKQENRNNAMKDNDDVKKDGVAGSNSEFKGTNLDVVAGKYANDKAVKNLVKNIDDIDFVSSDPDRPVLTGTYQDNGYIIATDGRTLTMIKSDYPLEDEGKIKGKNGYIDGKFPQYKKVIPSFGNNTVKQEGFEDFDKVMKTAMIAAAYQKYTKSKLPSFVRVGDKVFDGKQLAQAMAMAKKHGLTNVITRNENYAPVEFNGPKGSVVLMPMSDGTRETEFNANSGTAKFGDNERLAEEFLSAGEKETQETKFKKINAARSKMVSGLFTDIRNKVYDIVGIDEKPKGKLSIRNGYINQYEGRKMFSEEWNKEEEEKTRKQWAEKYGKDKADQAIDLILEAQKLNSKVNQYHNDMYDNEKNIHSSEVENYIKEKGNELKKKFGMKKSFLDRIEEMLKSMRIA